MWYHWCFNSVFVVSVFFVENFCYNFTNSEALSSNFSLTTLTNGSYDYYENFLDEEIGPDVLDDPGPIEEVLSSGQQRKPISPKRGFTPAEEMELLRLHNFYRSNVTPPAADMMFMEWDKELARIAQDWANKCKFKHGFPPNSYPGPMGQNLYRGPDEAGTRAMLLWYEEYVHYDFKSGNCETMKQCGHYTQLAWARSKLVGCGVRKCAPDKHIIVCHYSPPGNVRLVPPYVVGKPCSRCDSVDGGLCTTNLCVNHRQCERNPTQCRFAQCVLQCHNCGVLEKESCRCRCAPGWDSLDCSILCRDKHDSCGKSPGWPTKTACSMNQFAVQDKFCRKMCGQCRGLDENEITSNDILIPSNLQYQERKPKLLLRDGTCCSGQLCPDGHILDLERRLCSCRLLCPGPVCYDYPSHGRLKKLDSVLSCMLLGFFFFFTLEQIFI